VRVRLLNDDRLSGILRAHASRLPFPNLLAYLPVIVLSRTETSVCADRVGRRWGQASSAGCVCRCTNWESSIRLVVPVLRRRFEMCTLTVKRRPGARASSHHTRQPDLRGVVGEVLQNGQRLRICPMQILKNE
jgi:hypothetical protein